jgi:hypothetical protein
MARLDIAAKQLAGGYPSLPLAAGSADFVFNNPATASDGISFTNTGREILVVRNNTAGALTVTITSTAYLGRTGDIAAYSVGANGFAVFGPFPSLGFEQAGRKIYAVGSATGIQFAVIQLPPLV